MLLFHPLPLTGTMNACAAACTPGSPARRARDLRRTRTALFGDVPARRRSRFAITTPSCANPASRIIRLRRLRTNSSAPTTSTSDNATCATTSAAPQAETLARVGGSAAPRFHRRARRGAVARIAGSQAEQQARRHRERGGEREDPPVEGKRHENAIRFGREKADQKLAQPHGDERRRTRRRCPQAAGSRPASAGRCVRATRQSPAGRRSRARGRLPARASGSRDWRRRSTAPDPVVASSSHSGDS